MKLYITKNESAGASAVALDDMILTKSLPTTAGSRMLEGYMSLFDAEVVERLAAAGYSIAGKVNVGEFSIDLLGESSYYGCCLDENGNAASAACELLKAGEVKAVVCLDVNGMPRRAAALGGQVFIKPTYGTVSRFGTIPVACSGETVGVMAPDAGTCRELLAAIAGHDDKDGTSLPEEQCAKVYAPAAEAPKKVVVLGALCKGLDEAGAKKFEAFKSALVQSGVELCEIADEWPLLAGGAWNILLCAELCNNVSRYDGVKFGYRSPNHKNIDELYTNSRTEAFGELLKLSILFGSDVLSSGRYKDAYDRALRLRRLVCERFAAVFSEYDAVLLPACSRAAYSEAEAKDIHLAFEESRFTALASITGLPAAAAGGCQLIGPAFSEGRLLELVKMYQKEAGKA